MFTYFTSLFDYIVKYSIDKKKAISSEIKSFLTVEDGSITFTKLINLKALRTDFEKLNKKLVRKVKQRRIPFIWKSKKFLHLLYIQVIITVNIKSI